MDVLTEDVRDGSVMELLYADDLAPYESYGSYIRQNECSYCVVRKWIFWRWILVAYVMNRLVFNSFWCSISQEWVHCCCSDVPRQVSVLSCKDVFARRTFVGHNCSVKEWVEFKRDEVVLEVLEKLCYLSDIFRWGTHLYMSLSPSVRLSIHPSICLSCTISQEPYIIWS